MSSYYSIAYESWKRQGIIYVTAQRFEYCHEICRPLRSHTSLNSILILSLAIYCNNVLKNTIKPAFSNGVICGSMFYVNVSVVTHSDKEAGEKSIDRQETIIITLHNPFMNYE